MEKLSNLTLTDLALRERDYEWCQNIAAVAELTKDNFIVEDIKNLIGTTITAIDNDREIRVRNNMRTIDKLYNRINEKLQETIIPEIKKLNERIEQYNNQLDN